MMTLDSMTDDVTEKCDVAQIIDNLKQCKVQMKKNRKSLGRPLLVVFDEEIWVDAHPIPKYVSFFWVCFRFSINFYFPDPHHHPRVGNYSELDGR